jgi:hypothetical protein
LISNVHFLRICILMRFLTASLSLAAGILFLRLPIQNSVVALSPGVEANRACRFTCLSFRPNSRAVGLRLVAKIITKQTSIFHLLFFPTESFEL